MSEVIYVKEGEDRTFLIVDAAMNDLVRPSMYGAHHDIVPVIEAAAGAAAQDYDVVGPVCETGDTFAKARAMPPLAAGEAEQPGMSEESACLAVLGVDVDALGTAVGRHWGFDDEALWMVRRLPQSVSVHFTDADQDLLRLTASCANELVDAWPLPELQRSACMHRVAQRYGRALGLSIRDLVAAAQSSAGELAAPAPPAAE